MAKLLLIAGFFALLASASDAAREIDPVRHYAGTYEVRYYQPNGFAADEIDAREYRRLVAAHSCDARASHVAVWPRLHLVEVTCEN